MKGWIVLITDTDSNETTPLCNSAEQVRVFSSISNALNAADVDSQEYIDGIDHLSAEYKKKCFYTQREDKELSLCNKEYETPWLIYSVKEIVFSPED